MGKTTKQLAEELRVSKTAIRKRFTDEFKAQYVETNPDGSLWIKKSGLHIAMQAVMLFDRHYFKSFAERSQDFEQGVYLKISLARFHSGNDRLFYPAHFFKLLLCYPFLFSFLNKFTYQSNSQIAFGYFFRSQQ